MAQVDINLRDVIRVLRKRRWIILLAPVLMGLATFFLTEVPSPVYNAESMIQITRSSTVAGLMAELVTFSAYDTMATQIMIVNSQPVLEEVAYRMNLARRGEDPQRAIDSLKGLISAEQKAGSDILAIKATGGSAAEAVALANLTVDAYIHRYNADRDQRLDELVAFIEKRLDESTRSLQEAESELADFKRANALPLSMSPSQGLDLQEREFLYRQRQRDVESGIAELNRIQSAGDLDGLQQMYIHVEDVGVRTLSDDLSRRSLALNELRTRQADLLRYQTEVSPPVVALVAQISAEEKRIQSQIVNLIARLRSVGAEHQAILDAIARQQSELLRQPEVLTRLETMQSMVDERQSLATGLRKQFQDAEIQQREKIDEINIVERARQASQTPQPDRYYKAIVGAMIGVLLGFVFAFVLESLDTSIGTIEDVEQYVKSAVLGVIPHLEPDDVKARIAALKPPGNVTDDELSRFARLTTHFDAKAISSEAYRTMRTNVGSIMAREGKKVVLITSSMIQEGKTTSSSNLAVAFAQSGKRTLLIDADLRRPTTDRLFGIDKSPGLTDLLLGTRDPVDCYRTIDDLILGRFGLKLTQSSPGLEFLTVMPAGRVVDNPTEILASTAMDALLAEARGKFDVVILDVSPVLPVADAFVLAPKVDGVILVYQIGRVARDMLKRTKMRIEGLGGRVWGVVMNDIRSEIDYKQGDFQYYHYRYDVPAPDASLLGRMKQALGVSAEHRGKGTRSKSALPFNGHTRRVPSPSGTTQAVPQSPSSAQTRDLMSLTDDDPKPPST